MKQEFDLPYPKTWLNEGPLLDIGAGELTVRYDFAPPGENSRWVSIRFTRVIAYQYMDETCCLAPLDFISEGLVELDIESSPWLQRLRDRWDRYFVGGSVMHQMYGDFAFRHFGLWFDEYGCYEIIAREFNIETP